MKITKVSVIIPVYNAEKYLNRCLESVTGQTLKDIQVICVNDGSTDSSLQILMRYASYDKRFTVLSKPNSGSAASRNVALEKATGEYIYFVDNDDYIAPKALEVFCKVADRYMLDVVYSNPKWECDHPGMIDPYSSTKDPSREQMKLQNGKELFTSLVLSNNYFAAPWKRFIRKSFLDSKGCRFLEIANPHEDNLFSFIVDIEAGKVIFIKERLYTHRSHSASTMMKNQQGINLGPKVVSHFVCGCRIFHYVIEKKYNEETHAAINKRINGLWNRALEYFEASGNDWGSLNWHSAKVEENLFKRMFTLRNSK